MSNLAWEFSVRSYVVMVLHMSVKWRTFVKGNASKKYKTVETNFRLEEAPMK
jgi:hypothetical protein